MMENQQYIVIAVSLMQTGAPFFLDVPHGMEEVVMYYKQRYNNTATYITENGVAPSVFVIF
jgi:hypothetical protein